MRQQRSVVLALCSALLCASSATTSVRAGQTPAPPANSAPAASNLLDSIPYDAALRGPLLLTGWEMRGIQASGRPAHFESLSGLAEALERRVVPVGTLTVLAPATMRVIVEHPGKPDIYAGLRAEERFKILLAQFSTAQWQIAGSARGIGLADMTEAQRGLFIGLLPAKITLQHVKLMPTEKPYEHRYDRQGSPQEADPASARLRLVRKVEFRYSKTGADDNSVRGVAEPAGGDEITILEGNEQARGDAPVDRQTVTAFGVPIIQTVPSRLKPGQLNFRSAALQAPVSLDGDLKTLSDLLARVARVTQLDLIADKRVTDLPICLRFAPRQTVRAGDVLEALCWSVTGAFRRVGASTYLLTDDVQGIGTRFARLDEWAETSFEARYKALQEVTNAAAKHDPLAHIGFAPGDPHSLPPALLQRIDDAYRKERYNEPPAFKPSELPNAVQQAIERDAQFWEDNHIAIRTDRVQVGTTLSAQFVFPGDAAVEVPFAQNIGSQYLEQIAAPERTPAVPPVTAAPPSPQSMPATLRKRVLLARLPDEGKGLADLLGTAKTKGFTEVWLHVRLDQADASARLKAAVTVGKKAEIGVGAIVSLLHEGRMGGGEDLNIFEETGAQYAKRRAVTAPDGMRDYYARMAGWTVMDGEETTRRVALLARVAGLSAFVLNATAAPGWAGHSNGGDGIPSNGHLGYTPTDRLAYLRAEGVDPLDIAHYSYTLGEQANLPYFPCATEELWKSLHSFRLQENKRAMAVIYQALRQAAPTIPLYLDDRVSSYADPNTRWYARWEAAERVPVNPVYAVESEARASAFAQSSEPLLCLRGWSGKPDRMARRFGDTAQDAAKNWRGVTLDLANLTSADALRMLSGLPNDAGASR